MKNSKGVDGDTYSNYRLQPLEEPLRCSLGNGWGRCEIRFNNNILSDEK